MKSADIEAILEVNPDARFARVPHDSDTYVCYLTDLVVSEGRGRWRATHVNTKGRVLGTVHVAARSICPAEDAEAKVAATIARNAAHYESARRAEQVAKDLTCAGVTARASAGRVVVDEASVEALAALLRRL